jgi:hypothetical protein
MQRLLSFVLAISPSFERVSGSTSHILLILTRRWNIDSCTGMLLGCWREGEVGVGVEKRRRSLIAFLVAVRESVDGWSRNKSKGV